MLVKKCRSNKTCPKQRQRFSSREGRIVRLVKKYHAKVASKTLANFSFQKKTVLKKFVMNFCTEKLPKAQSTVSKCSSKSTVKEFFPRHRQKIAIKELQNGNACQKVNVKKCYPKHGFKTLSKSSLNELFVKKYRSKLLPETLPTLLFQKRPY